MSKKLTLEEKKSILQKIKHEEDMIKKHEYQINLYKPLGNKKEEIKELNAEINKRRERLTVFYGQLGKKPPKTSEEILEEMKPKTTAFNAKLRENEAKKKAKAEAEAKQSALSARRVIAIEQLEGDQSTKKQTLAREEAERQAREEAEARQAREEAERVAAEKRAKMIDSEARQTREEQARIKQSEEESEAIRQLEIIRKKAIETELKLEKALLEIAKQKAKDEAETKTLENLVEKRKEELALITQAQVVTQQKLLQQLSKTEKDQLQSQLKKQEEDEAILKDKVAAAKQEVKASNLKTATLRAEAVKQRDQINKARQADRVAKKILKDAEEAAIQKCGSAAIDPGNNIVAACKVLSLDDNFISKIENNGIKSLDAKSILNLFYNNKKKLCLTGQNANNDLYNRNIEKAYKILNAFLDKKLQEASKSEEAEKARKLKQLKIEKEGDKQFLKEVDKQILKEERLIEQKKENKRAEENVERINKEEVEKELEYCKPAERDPGNNYTEACKVLGIEDLLFINRKDARNILNDAYSDITKTCVNRKSKKNDKNYEPNIDKAYFLLKDILDKKQIQFQIDVSKRESERQSEIQSEKCASAEKDPGVNILLACDVLNIDRRFIDDIENNKIDNADAITILGQKYNSRIASCVTGNTNVNAYRANIAAAFEILETFLFDREDLKTRQADYLREQTIIQKKLEQERKREQEREQERKREQALEAKYQSEMKKQNEIEKIIAAEKENIARLQQEAQERATAEGRKSIEEQLARSQLNKQAAEKEQKRKESIMSDLIKKLKTSEFEAKERERKRERERDLLPLKSGPGTPGLGGPPINPINPVNPINIKPLQEATLAAMSLFKIPFNKTFFKIISSDELVKKKQGLLKELENNTLDPNIPLDKLKAITNLAYDYLAIILENLNNIIIGNSLNHLPLEKLNSFYTKLDPVIFNQLINLSNQFVPLYKDITFNESTIILRPRITNQTRKATSRKICNELGQLNPLINSLRGIPSQMRKLTRKVNLEAIQKNIKIRKEAISKQKKQAEEEETRQRNDEIETAEKNIENKKTKAILSQINQLTAEIAGLAEPDPAATPAAKQQFIKFLERKKGELANLKKALPNNKEQDKQTQDKKAQRKKSKGGNRTRKVKGTAVPL